MRSLVLLLILTAIALSSTAAQPYVNVQVNSRMNSPEETSICINPSNPDNIVGAAQSPCRYYYSFDGGLSWGEGDLSDPYDLGDPAITFDRQGNAYYCYIGRRSHSGIFINKTTDGGVSWQQAGTAIVEREGPTPFEDKSYPVCDITDSPHSGNLYVGWTHFSFLNSSDPSDSTWIHFSRSTDQAITFSEPLRISDRGGSALDSDDTVEGAVPAVGPDGTVYVAWSGPRGIEFDKSTDGGVTFGIDRVITDQPGGWVFDIPGIYRANGLPVTKADISDGPYSGRVYVNWADQRHGDKDIFLIYSDDGGETWGDVIRVNDDEIGNGADQFFSWIDVDPITGHVYLVFYDRRAYPSWSISTDVYLAVSENGGESFTNILLSESPFVPNPGIFFGDYIGISAYDGRVRPLWMRLDDTVLSIWTALIDSPIGEDNGGVATRLLVAPNPTRTGLQIFADGFLREACVLMIHDIEGRHIRTVKTADLFADRLSVWWNCRDANDRLVPPGSYYVSGRGFKPAKIVVVR